MSEDLVRNALARRKELLSELRKLDRFLQMAQRLGGPVSQQALLAESLEDIRVRWKEAPRPSDLIELTTQILLAEGKPMSRRAIFQRVIDAGVNLPGKDPIRNFGTVLWRSGKFDNTGRTYWFKDQHRPEEK